MWNTKTREALFSTSKPEAPPLYSLPTSHTNKIYAKSLNLNFKQTHLTKKQSQMHSPIVFVTLCLSLLSRNKYDPASSCFVP